MSNNFLERILSKNKNKSNDTTIKNQEVEAKATNVVEDFVPEVYEISGDKDILMEFVVEAEDHLSAIETILLEKESGYSLDDLNAIFRAVHSLKGGSAYFSLKEITTTSHSTEYLMDKARNEKLVFNQALKSIVLRYIDLQRNLLEHVKEAFTSGSNLQTTKEASVYQASIDDYLASLTMIDTRNWHVYEIDSNKRFISKNV